MGKVLLAALEPDEFASRITADSFLAGGGPNALSDVDSLVAQLALVREQGYAIQDEELARGLRSVAAPVIGRGGTTMAAVNLAVSAGRHDVDELRGSFLDKLLTTTAEIGRRLQRL